MVASLALRANVPVGRERAERRRSEIVSRTHQREKAAKTRHQTTPDELCHENKASKPSRKTCKTRHQTTPEENPCPAEQSKRTAISQP